MRGELSKERIVMKVKLVFEKSYQGLKGLTANTFSKDINVDLPEGFEMANIVSAVCYDLMQGSNHPSSDIYANIWDHEDEGRLVGKLLTYIDATYSDKEQREAHKALVKDLMYGYFGDLHTRAVQTIQSQTK